MPLWVTRQITPSPPTANMTREYKLTSDEDREWDRFIHTDQQQLTSDVINIDHLFIMQCSAGKPWVPALMWMPLDQHTPPKHGCGPSTPPHGNSPTSGTIRPNTPKKLLRNSLRTTRHKTRSCCNLTDDHSGLK